MDWEQLNPARGDQSPKAGTLWGDRKGTGPTGFLVQFVDGFSSPPHIHNVSYRGVVVSGLVHNDDPSAAPMWMPPGSYWTQPKGEAHITAARGGTNVAYIEIEEGPYLVLPVAESFDSGERPINVDESNIVWLDASNTAWVHHSEAPTSARSAEVAFLWGDPQDGRLNGTLLKLPPGYRGKIHSHGSTFRAVVIRGRIALRASRRAGVETLPPGSSFSSSGPSVHHVSGDREKGCIIYVRAAGSFDVVSAHR
ncbi:MAG: DUF4437 domain-containing protein [Acidimicrobiia bacterium]|nr:DUF4437 domain-containing protein [Acidimicrobiia bacterium]